MDVETAKLAAEKGLLNQWVHDYLVSEKENQLDEYLQKNDFQMFGPKQIEITSLERTIGPEQGLLNKETQDEMDMKISRRIAQLKEGREIPIIAEEDNGHFVICDGSHLFEALKSLGRTKCWVVYWQGSKMHNEVKKRQL